MPSKPDKMKEAIQSRIEKLMEEVMDSVLKTDPFILKQFQSAKPIYAALVPGDIFRKSHFERRFTSRFGKVWEDLAVVAAEHGLGNGQKEVRIEGTIKQGRVRRITEVLKRLEHPAKGKKRKSPNWPEELSYVLKGSGKDTSVQVVCDVLAEDTKNGAVYAFELKAPLPNSDQTKVSKEKILKLYAMEPRQVTDAYYALPYNPYGKREDYAWNFPARWFNMKEDDVVLIGDEFWEKIGGAGTYQAFIDAVNEVGEIYKNRIYREFLGIEPPDEDGISELK